MKLLVSRYLNDVEEGGETVFPNLPAAPHQTRENGFSECALEGLAAKPRKGDAGACAGRLACWSGVRAMWPASGRGSLLRLTSACLCRCPAPPPAVLFHSIKTTGELEKDSLHTAWCAAPRWNCSCLTLEVALATHHTPSTAHRPSP